MHFHGTCCSFFPFTHVPYHQTCLKTHSLADLSRSVTCSVYGENAILARQSLRETDGVVPLISLSGWHNYLAGVEGCESAEKGLTSQVTAETPVRCLTYVHAQARIWPTTNDRREHLHEKIWSKFVICPQASTFFYCIFYRDCTGILVMGLSDKNI